MTDRFLWNCEGHGGPISKIQSSGGSWGYPLLRKNEVEAVGCQGNPWERLKVVRAELLGTRKFARPTLEGDGS